MPTLRIRTTSSKQSNTVFILSKFIRLFSLFQLSNRSYLSIEMQGGHSPVTFPEIPDDLKNFP